MTLKREEIALAARAWVGTPYRHQASRIGIGCDCLGLLRGVWRQVIGNEPIKIPPYSANWRDKESAGALELAAKTYLITSAKQPQIGDVVLFKMIANMPPKHCAIMVEKNIFVHAQENIGVVEASLSISWAKRISGVYSF